MFTIVSQDAKHHIVGGHEFLQCFKGDGVFGLS